MITDLLLENNDLVFGPDGEPVLISEQAAISQDIINRIRESGKLKFLIKAQRSRVETVLQEIKALVIEDERIDPGSCSLALDQAGKLSIRAETINQEEIVLNV